jgi:phenylacetyl-CoA:acceptor oxidoreductase subunit 2
MILKEAKGIPAWRAPLIVPLTVATGLAEGGGLLLIALSTIAPLDAAAQLLAPPVVVLAALRAWVWRAYVGALVGSGAPMRTLEVLAAFRPWFFVVGLALPVVLVATAYVVAPVAWLLFAMAGLSAAAAGIALKFVLVTRAAYNQGFALAHTPVRGWGAAGPGIKPGWSLS